MKLLESASRAIDSLNRRIGRATIWLILGSIVVSAGNAVMRKAFGLSSNLWLELQWQLYGAAFMCAAAYVLLVDEHVRIDVVSQRFGPRLRAWLDIAVLLLIVFPVCLLMLAFGGAMALHAWRSGETSFHPGGPVLWPIIVCIPLGFGLLGLQVISELIKRVGFLFGRREKPALSEAELPEFMPEASASGDTR